MDRRRLSACANFIGYSDGMGYINQPNVSISNVLKSYWAKSFFSWMRENVIDFYYCVLEKNKNRANYFPSV